jgi:hypothetical protein
MAVETKCHPHSPSKLIAQESIVLLKDDFFAEYCRNKAPSNWQPTQSSAAIAGAYCAAQQRPKDGVINFSGGDP